jgi:hypothetical protein
LGIKERPAEQINPKAGGKIRAIKPEIINSAPYTSPARDKNFISVI